jgi:hypothetical protein
LPFPISFVAGGPVTRHPRRLTVCLISTLLLSPIIPSLAQPVKSAQDVRHQIASVQVLHVTNSVHGWLISNAVLGKMWGNPANPELIQIPAGQLYLVRPNSIKGSRECM